MFLCEDFNVIVAFQRVWIYFLNNSKKVFFRDEVYLKKSILKHFKV